MRRFDASFVGGPLLLRAQGIQAAARAPLFQLVGEIVMRFRDIARARVRFDHPPLRNDAQVRVRRRKRDLPAGVGGAQLGHLLVVHRLRAARPGRGGDDRQIGIDGRGDLIPGRDGRPAELHARVERCRRHVSVDLQAGCGPGLLQEAFGAENARGGRRYRRVLFHRTPYGVLKRDPLNGRRWLRNDRRAEALRHNYGEREDRRAHAPAQKYDV